MRRYKPTHLLLKELFMRKVAILSLIAIVMLTSCGTQKGKGLGYHLPEQSETTTDMQDVTEGYTASTSETVVATIESGTTSTNVEEITIADITIADTTPAADEEGTMTEDMAISDTIMELAMTYNTSLHLSKQGLYEHLLNYDKMKITEEEAQYAVDNIDADFKENAVKTANAYKSYMGMSGQEIYDMLRSDVDKFTTEEARYAIEHMS